MSIKKPVFWISGNYYDSSEAVNLIIDKFGNENITILDSTSDGVDRVISNLVEQEIFSSGNKIIRLKGLPENYNLIYDYLKFVSEKRVLIIESPTFTKIKNKVVNAALSNLYKEIKKIGKVIDSPTELNDTNAKGWIDSLCERRFKKTIEEEAIPLLLYLKNNNADIIYSELLKLSTYIGKRKKITLDDVKQVVKTDYAFDTWKFVDDLVDGDMEKCIYAFEDYFLTRENFIYEIESLLGAILYRFELMLLIRSCGDTNVLSSFKKKPKDKPITDKYSSGMINMIKYSKNNLGTIKLTSILSVLYFTLNSIRANGGDSSFCKLILFNMTSALCGKITREEFFSMYSGGRQVIFENLQGAYNE